MPIEGVCVNVCACESVRGKVMRWSFLCLFFFIITSERNPSFFSKFVVKDRALWKLYLVVIVGLASPTSLKYKINKFKVSMQILVDYTKIFHPILLHFLLRHQTSALNGSVWCPTTERAINTSWHVGCLVIIVLPQHAIFNDFIDIGRLEINYEIE